MHLAHAAQNHHLLSCPKVISCLENEWQKGYRQSRVSVPKMALYYTHLFCYMAFAASYLTLVVDSTYQHHHGGFMETAGAGNRTYPVRVPAHGSNHRRTTKALWAWFYVYGLAHILEELSQVLTLTPMHVFEAQAEKQQHAQTGRRAAVVKVTVEDKDLMWSF